MPKQSAGTRRLLERGSASYLEVLRELRGFRREVVSRSQAALKSRVGKLSRALGLKRDRGDVGHYEAPSLEPDAGGREEVGACLAASLWLSLNCALYVGLSEDTKSEPIFDTPDEYRAESRRLASLCDAIGTLSGLTIKHNARCEALVTELSTLSARYYRRADELEPEEPESEDETQRAPSNAFSIDALFSDL